MQVRMAKFKNIKKKQRNGEKIVKKGIKKNLLGIKSPKIKRAITETTSGEELLQAHILSNSRSYFYLGICLLLAAGIIVLSYTIFRSDQHLLMVKKERQTLQTDLTRWQSQEQQHASYRDGYVYMAVLAYRLGSTQQEILFLNRALAIDPNYEPALRLRGLLMMRN